MFTGIIEKIGKIKKIEGNRFLFSHSYAETFEIGESVAISGMCATIIDVSQKTFSVEIMKESRDRTIFGSAKIGDFFNLERAAKIGDRNSGHFVLGHVDLVGKILSRTHNHDFECFRIDILPEYSDLIVFKGSIAVDGISLTISDLGKTWFEVSIISHTLENTNLGTKKSGDIVNLEFDVLGKYVIRSIKN